MKLAVELMINSELLLNLEIIQSDINKSIDFKY